MGTAAGMASQVLGDEEIIGESTSLQYVKAQAALGAPTDSTVLILGETGTGKGRIAALIHQISARCQQPFIKVNCAAIPLGLLESELFGHERGAFTGPITQRPGRFELANGGTLFLDEVGDIRPSCNPSCYASFRSMSSSASAAPKRFGPTSVWWRQPTTISAAWSSKIAFGATCSIG